MNASDYTRERARTDAETLVQMFPELRARAFAVQGVEDFNRLKRIQEAVAKLSEGGDWKELQREIAAELPGGDTEKRAETILRTNGFQAYAAARYRRAQGRADIFPYWKYVTMDDDRVRSRHAELDGVILPANDPFWKDHYPPWDFNCRCMVVELTEEDAQEEAEAGEGSMWDVGTRQMWMARHAHSDMARQYHFRPDSLEMDLRDLAKAESRTAEDMKEFGELMEGRMVGTGELGADGEEVKVSVRDWLWQPLRAEYAQRVERAADGREHVWMLDAWTGEELGYNIGDSTSVAPPPPMPGREVKLIHNHPGSSTALSPGDVLAATREGRESVEAFTLNGEWRSIQAKGVRDPHMIEELEQWRNKYRSKARGVRRDLLNVTKQWQEWLGKMEQYGYVVTREGKIS